MEIDPATAASWKSPPCVAPDIVDQSLMEWQERVAGRIDAAGNDPARPCNKMSGACPMMST